MRVPISSSALLLIAGCASLIEAPLPQPEPRRRPIEPSQRYKRAAQRSTSAVVESVGRCTKPQARSVRPAQASTSVVAGSAGKRLKPRALGWCVRPAQPSRSVAAEPAGRRLKLPGWYMAPGQRSTSPAAASVARSSSKRSNVLEFSNEESPLCGCRSTFSAGLGDQHGRLDRRSAAVAGTRKQAGRRRTASDARHDGQMRCNDAEVELASLPAGWLFSGRRGRRPVLRPAGAFRSAQERVA